MPATLQNLYARKLFIYLIYRIDDLKKTSIRIDHFSISVVHLGCFAASRDPYSMLKKALEDLSSIGIPNSKNQKLIAKSQYHKGKGYADVTFSKDAMPYLVQCHSIFLKHKMFPIAFLSGHFDYKLYILLKLQKAKFKKHTITFTSDELKRLLNIPDKNFHSLEPHIKNSVNSINRNTELIVECGFRKFRHITNVSFKVMKKARTDKIMGLFKDMFENAATIEGCNKQEEESLGKLNQLLQSGLERYQNFLKFIEEYERKANSVSLNSVIFQKDEDDSDNENEEEAKTEISFIEKLATFWKSLLS